MSTHTYKRCDIKACQNPPVGITEREILVKFLTEQEEGRAVDKPYLEKVRIDLCGPHWDEYVKRISFTATGAQGHNDYFIHGAGEAAEGSAA